MWSWLVAQGLIKDLIAASVAVAVGHVFAWRPLRAHRRRLDRIADLLDTGTPGGLGELAKGMQGQSGKVAK
jgi:HAMP domain-containing protein